MSGATRPKVLFALIGLHSLLERYRKIVITPRRRSCLAGNHNHITPGRESIGQQGLFRVERFDFSYEYSCPCVK
jgi:hypothetical protein